MTNVKELAIGLSALLALAAGARGDAKVTMDRRPLDGASADWKFEKVPAPSAEDAGNGATFTLVDGQSDRNGAALSALHDGQAAGTDDEPGSSFFFRAGSPGGRIGIDLGVAADVVQVNTYSWHRDTRAPQVYKLYAADGKAQDFDPAPKAGADPATRGWTLVANVDTRPKEGAPGGQYGVSIGDPEGKPVGTYRHLLLDVGVTETQDPFGNTFFSEVDVVAKVGGELLKPAKAAPTKRTTVAGKYEITIDTTGLNADMAKWAEETLRPVCEAWYPKIVEMLPSEGYDAPAKFGIVFRDDMGGTPAAAAGTRVMCNRQWFEKNLKGEAVGAVVHEMVHVVQQYGGRRGNRGQVPFWLQEGIPDYIRWFLYEPEKRGAEIRDPGRVKYDNAYRVSANFLNWAVATYDKTLVQQVNAAIRQGKYSDEIWKKLTGKTLDELDAEWKASLAKKK